MKYKYKNKSNKKKLKSINMQPFIRTNDKVLLNPVPT